MRRRRAELGNSAATKADKSYTKAGERPRYRKFRVFLTMKKVLSVTEVVARARSWLGPWELRASAEAQYDEAKHLLVVRLKSCARPADANYPCGITVDWLPGHRVRRESVPWTRALPAAEDIFRRWVRKVRLAVPSPANN
jgi:hypothetical protein